MDKALHYRYDELHWVMNDMIPNAFSEQHTCNNISKLFSCYTLTFIREVIFFLFVF